MVSVWMQHHVASNDPACEGLGDPEFLPGYALAP